MRFAFILSAVCGLLGGLSVPAQATTPDVLEKLNIDSERLGAIRRIVAEGIRSGEMPGAVVLVRYRGETIFHEAFGQRQVTPVLEPMTTDTIFDLASLTKPVCTATCIHLLMERGELSPDTLVSSWIPDFGQRGKHPITVKHLLTHQSGLIPDNALSDYADGPKVAFDKIHALPLWKPIGEQFAYSDVNFLVLGELVEEISGMPLDAFARKEIFAPLGMRDTMFTPASELIPRIAPTARSGKEVLRGMVHDPRAQALGGIAGHAGLFSTAEDLARFADMVIQQGRIGEKQLFKPGSIALMVAPQPVSSGIRSLGWDKQSPYSSNKGDLLSDQAIGHGGFTGTVLWIDPAQELTVVFLSSRLHPDGKGSVNPLAGRIATVAAAALPPRTATAANSSRQ